MEKAITFQSNFIFIFIVVVEVVEVAMEGQDVAVPVAVVGLLVVAEPVVAVGGPMPEVEVEGPMLAVGLPEVGKGVVAGNCSWKASVGVECLVVRVRVGGPEVELMLLVVEPPVAALQSVEGRRTSFRLIAELSAEAR